MKNKIPKEMKHRRYNCLNIGMAGHKSHTVTHDGDGAVCHQSKLCGVTYAWEDQEDKKGKMVKGKRPFNHEIVVVGGCQANRIELK